MLFPVYIVGLVIPAILSAPSEIEDNGEAKIWAVLVAGSNRFQNYAHQANLCHVYQILHKNGVPDSRIIVMMYDDIANNPKNPNPGVIINKPNGPNVYGPKEVPKDYVGTDVTPQNFMNVLTGNSKAMEGVGSGRVLKSGPNDHVFVHYLDHGAPGYVLFPNHGDVLYAHQLIKTLQKMHRKKMYKKMVIYLEACFSGSMFENMLPNDKNIFATTSSKSTEYSWFYDYDTTLQTWLTTLYGLAWMDDIETAESYKNFTGETLLQQFNTVYEIVTTSPAPPYLQQLETNPHPQMFGDMSMKTELVKDYLGATSTQTERPTQVERLQNAVSSREAALYILNMKIQKATTDEEKAALVKERDILIEGRKAVDQLFSRILVHVTSQNIEDIKMLESSQQPLNLDMMPCYKTLVENFMRSCLNIHNNSYAIGHMYKLANLCSLQYSSSAKVLQAYQTECTDYHRALSDVN